VHHLHGAACKTEGHGPQRALTSPIGNLIEGGPEKCKVSGSSRRIRLKPLGANEQGILHSTLLLLLTRQRHLSASLA
jgi:hypothetical protein